MLTALGNPIRDLAMQEPIEIKLNSATPFSNPRLAYFLWWLALIAALLLVASGLLCIFLIATTAIIPGILLIGVGFLLLVGVAINHFLDSRWEPTKTFLQLENELAKLDGGIPNISRNATT
jgi:hypothetical protein